jgi:hypothetical protein
MEDLEQNEVADVKPSPLHTITPLSKYLAMVLFVILPFLGGWIGYSYAPERVVIHEEETSKNTGLKPSDSQKEIVKPESGLEEKSPQEILETHFPALIDINVGDSFGAFAVNAIEIDSFTPFFGGPNREPYTIERGRHTVLVSLNGTTSLSGKVLIENSLSDEGRTAGTAFYIGFKPASSELEKLPFIDGFTSENSRDLIIVEGLENHPFILDTLNSVGCTLNDWCTALASIEGGEPVISDDLEITISGFKLYEQTWPSARPAFPETTLVE